MEYFKDRNHTYEITDHVPTGYEIWNIGENIEDGWLPLVKVYNEHCVDTTCMKVIKVKEAQTILAGMGYGPKTIKEMERYIKRYSKSNRAVIKRRVARMEAAVEVMKTLKWE